MRIFDVEYVVNTQYRDMELLGDRQKVQVVLPDLSIVTAGPPLANKNDFESIIALLKELRPIDESRQYIHLIIVRYKTMSEQFRKTV